MITITRRLARQLRTVLRQALAVSSRGPAPAVSFMTGPHGMHVRSASTDAAVEYHVPGDHPIQQITVPGDLLRECEGPREDPLTIDLQGDQQVVARWQDGGVPQVVACAAAEPVDPADFPRLPEAMAENPPGLLIALRDAADTTDPEATRYALGCVQLDGACGRLATTDGRQLLIQSGFRFPWDGSLLVPRSRIFGCQTLPQDEPVSIGTTGRHLALAVGPWRIFLAVNAEGRFPDVQHHVPRSDTAVAHCELSAGDARFLTRSLPRLPGDKEYNLPVTLDLNGQAIVRAKATGQAQPTELVLSASMPSGEPVRVNLNRKYLARAVRLGFQRLDVFGKQAPVLCQDNTRQYVWAVLDPEACLAPSPDALRIESTGLADTLSTSTPRRKCTKMTNSRNGNSAAGAESAPGSQTTTPAKAAARRSSKPAEDDVLRQALALRDALRKAAGSAGELVRAIKQDRKQAQRLHSTLASLRQLQTLDA